MSASALATITSPEQIMRCEDIIPIFYIEIYIFCYFQTLPCSKLFWLFFQRRVRISDFCKRDRYNILYAATRIKE